MESTLMSLDSLKHPGFINGYAMNFLAVAQQKYLSDIKDNKVNIGHLIYHLPVVSVNVSMGIELLLKALIKNMALSIPKSHNLKLLFEFLPTIIRGECVKRLEARKNQYPDYDICFLHKESNFDLAKYMDMRVDNLSVALLAMLELQSHIFVEFRYLFEFPEAKKDTYFIDLPLLFSLGDILSDFNSEIIFDGGIEFNS